MSIVKPIFLFFLTLVHLTTLGQSQVDTRTISIQVIPGLQYDLVRFQVKPGEKVKLVFSNDDDMGHNLLITTPGSREEIVTMALQLAQKGPQMNYIPVSDKVLWSIPVIYAGESKTLEFTAPKEPGHYPFVFTFPGHWRMMNGVMIVEKNG